MSGFLIGGLAADVHDLLANPVFGGAVSLAGLVLALIGFAVGRFTRFSIIRGKHQDRKNSAHWHAAKSLLELSLFVAVQKSVADETIEKILEYLEEHGAGLSGRLFKASRIFVESRVFRAASPNESNKPLTSVSVTAALSGLRPQLDEALAALDDDDLLARDFATCFQLGTIEAPATDPKASTYFQALAEIEQATGYRDQPGKAAPERWRSLTKVIVNDGFVAPTYLVGGLLNEFKDDWQTLLNVFHTIVPDNASRFVRVQGFEFYCWLLWGPSIPACSCRAWDGALIALQYGYGDENNSFPLVLEHELAENAWHDLLKRMAVNAGRPPVMAVGAIFTGSIVWGPRIDAGNAEVPGVYFVSHDNGKKRQSVFKGLMLGADSIGPSIAPRLYYSAYAWIMFEACKPDMTPLYNSREDRWKSLLPIFEHANIADGETLAFLKERLAEKAWRAIVDLERSDDIRFRYVCAIDDPGGVSTDRGKHDLRFQLGEATRPKRLRELFGEAVLIAEGASKADASDRGAFQAACEKSATWSRIFKRPEDRSQIITSCDLPEIVADCYRIAHAAHTG